MFVFHKILIQHQCFRCLDLLDVPFRLAYFQIERIYGMMESLLLDRNLCFTNLCKIEKILLIFFRCKQEYRIGKLTKHNDIKSKISRTVVTTNITNLWGYTRHNDVKTLKTSLTIGGYNQKGYAVTSWKIAL